MWSVSADSIRRFWIDGEPAELKKNIRPAEVGKSRGPFSNERPFLIWCPCLVPPLGANHLEETCSGASVFQSHIH